MGGGGARVGGGCGPSYLPAVATNGTGSIHSDDTHALLFLLAAVRAAAAERHADAMMVKQDQQMEELEEQNKGLERENDLLRSKVGGGALISVGLGQ